MAKKQLIIDAAIELFAQQGYDNTSINAICAHAKVSKGAVFHHFANKEELLVEVFARMALIISEINAELAPTNEGATPLAQLENLLEQIFVGMALPQQRQYYLFDYQVRCHPNLKHLLQPQLAERDALMLASFESLLSELGSQQPRVDSLLLIAEIDGIALNYLLAADDYPLTAMKQQFINKYLSSYQQ
ncbi:TetR/AcrR family transcriptional regulator [Ferrimonas senticii]|uniref:TetR/AcrR family transcriptional regulator n=1 Tax=Ferrimonas senticii TaxID=394566 RepID=UPI0004075065|nr:TetR/AcrR family transcriptional regulator [Ferrimonas senticii]